MRVSHSFLKRVFEGEYILSSVVCARFHAVIVVERIISDICIFPHVARKFLKL